MRVSLLGPLRVEVGTDEIPLAAAKERVVLSALARHPGTPVASEALVDALWGDDPPRSARKTLQTYISNLRRVLGADVVMTEPSGYRLRVADDDVDVARFRRLVHQGEEALRTGAFDRASSSLQAATALWRGDPFPDAADLSALASEGVRLREEYLSALEARVTADLAGGEHAALVGELEALVRKHPFRERLWGHLMVALYRGGRQADALAAYQRARTELIEQLGLEPGGELRRLEAAVLEQDPSLDAPPAPVVSAGKDPVARSPVRYALTRDGVHVAYQVVGDGPIDILAVPGVVSHLDMWWDAPTDALVRRLASFSRLILFDKRGMGLSDRPARVESADWVEDTRAVFEAAGCERAVILGISAGSPTALVFTAQHPELARALVLCGGYARMLHAGDYEFGLDHDLVMSTIDEVERDWGTGVGISYLAPSRAADPSAVMFWARCQVLSASPTAAAAFLHASSVVDVRSSLPDISAPTLIVHPARDEMVPVEAARYIQKVIPDATLVETDSDIHLLWLSDVIGEVTNTIEAFIKERVTN